MNLVTKLLENSLEIKSKKINTLVIEDRKYFTLFLREIIDNINKESETLDLIEDYKKLDFSKSTEVIFDLFNLDANGASLLKKLYTELEKDLNSEDMYKKKIELESSLSNFIDDLVYRSRFSLSYGEINYSSLFKSFTVGFDYDKGSTIESLIEYLKVSSDLLNKKLFIIINLDSFLTDDDLIELANFLCYNEIKVLGLQNSITRELNSCDNLRIVDKDLCEI